MQHLDEPRLADPGFACQQHRLTFSGCRALESFEQQRHLLLAADKGGEPAGARLEPALDCPLADNAPSLDRVDKPLEALRAELVEGKSSADHLPGQPVDDHLIRLGQAFQPRREVRRLAGDRAGLAASGSVEVAYHDRTGGDSRMRP